MLTKLLKRNITLITFLIFASLSGWWVVIQRMDNPSDFALELFSGTYWVMAFLGALAGLKISGLWGGRESYIGRAIQMFSFGLLAQVFGQITYSLYTLILHDEIPYPSIGDIGYFGAIPLYIYGVWLLGKAVGAQVSLKSLGSKLQAIIIPLAILAVSYWFFLRGYEPDWSQPLIVFLDLGYPLGPAVYFSLAILVFTLSRKFLGGVMRSVILFVLFALVMQYLADFMFLYQNYHETWTTAGLNDYVYLFSYFVITISLLPFYSIFFIII